jgi:hypothetical protein
VLRGLPCASPSGHEGSAEVSVRACGRREDRRVKLAGPGTAIALAALLAAGACTTSRPASAAGPFEYKATAGWYAGTTPDVTSMTIDGQPYASGETYMIDEIYPTYDLALASFVPREVVITTTTETLTFQIDLGGCEDLPPDSLDRPILAEEDHFATIPSQQPPPSVEFYLDCGKCSTADKLVGFCARTLP